MLKNIRKGRGVSYPVWYGHIDKEDRKLAGFKTWRDFYECDMNPDEAVMRVKMG